MSESLEALKQHSSILDLYASRLKLTKQAKDRYRAECPFGELHKNGVDRTPSLDVFLDKGTWIFKCLGCGTSDSIFGLLQQTDKVPFKDAVRIAREFTSGWFKDRGQVESVFKSVGQEKDKPLKTFPESDYVKLEEAFAQSKEAQAFLLKERGIDLQTAKRLRVGFRQDVGKLAGSAVGEDVSAGGWLAFPTFAVGMSRAITSVKYRSIKEKLFTKQPGMGTFLFNSESIDFCEPIFLVEGELDCLSLEQAGFRAVSLPNATCTVTPEWKDLLMSAECVILAGDNDGAAGTKKMQQLWAEMQERTFYLKWPGSRKDANEFFLTVCNRNLSVFRTKVNELTQLAKSTPMPGIYSLQEMMVSRAEDNIADHPHRFRFPWANVDAMAILAPGAVIGFTATNTGMGKALASTTQVATPTGFTAIGDLKVGDHVIGKDGKPTEVLGVYPQGVRKGFRVSFTDNTSVVCDRDHLWEVRSNCQKINGTKRVLSVRQILAMETLGQEIKSADNGYRHHLPTVDPVQFVGGPLPLKPYLMGALLGDGGFTCNTISFTNTDPELIARVESELPDGMTLPQNNIQYRLKYRHGHKNPVKDALRELGLLGKHSHNKFIPDVYKFASLEDRIQFLQGLMDTDGCRAKNNSLPFCTVSEQMMNDFVFLVRSLGGIVQICTQDRADKRRRLYICYPRLPKSINPFFISRKASKYHVNPRSTRDRSIEKIERCENVDMTCIKVAAEDGLFVLEDFIVTHNTTFIIQATLESARKHGEVVLNYQAELSQEQIARMVASQVLFKHRLELSKADYNQAAELIGSAKYYIGRNPTLTTITPVLDLIEAGVRRLSPTVVVLDNLHFLCRFEPDQVKAMENAMQRIKNMAATYNLKFFVLGAPKKADSTNKGKSLHISDVRGSASFGDDSDAVFTLHRDIIKDRETNKKDEYEPATKIRLVKVRDKGPGDAEVDLVFIGERATFSEVTYQEQSGQMSYEYAK